MHIWVDADACPRVIKEILFRAADRLQVPVTLVANKLLHTPRSPFVDALQVARGFDVADSEIVRRVQAGDLVISADIPLAALVVEKGGHVIDPRGQLLDADNIQQRLTLRNFMDELRGAGVDTGGPAAIGHRDRQAFANQLERFLSARIRR
ncbi:MAG: YaiI/YqxD family protein [Deltaproteobacteria bacterium]|nr:YaiI/YqxD family protein [Deltaproteobacteria bacterium]